MGYLQNFMRIIKGKNVKRLAGHIILTSMLVIIIVFSAVLAVNNYSKLKLMDQYIHEIPKIVADREEELDTRSKIFEEDVLVRGELGLRIYSSETDLQTKEKLNMVRSTIAADSVTLVSEGGTILDTTGVSAPMDLVEKKLKTIELRTPLFEVYQDADGKNDARAFVMFPVKSEPGRKLLFEFSCEPLLEVYNAVGDWQGIFERTLSGLEIYAFMQSGDNDPVGYPLDEFRNNEKEQILKEAAGVFRKSVRFISNGNGCRCGPVFVRRQPMFAMVMPYPAKDLDILFLIPLWQLTSTGIYCALAISAFIIFSLILFSIYVSKLKAHVHLEKDDKESKRKLKDLTRSGRILMIAAISCFSIMLLLLENRANIAFIATTKQLALEYEIMWHGEQTDEIDRSYTDIYRTRTQAVANLLMQRGEYRARRDLMIFCDTLRADYLMLFDKNGSEIMSSNSYTGFSAGGPESNMDEEYRAVLLGYPSAVVGPKENPYSGKQEIGAAVLLTRDEGLADGFLLAVFDADAMNAELKKASLENTVNTFAVAEGCEAAVINEEDGKFIACTDPGKVGYEAQYYIATEAYGDEYADFTEYDGKNMYVSGISEDGKSLLFMVPDHPEDKEDIIALVMIAALILIMSVFFCPKACRLLITDGSEETKNVSRKNPLMTFAYGYIGFFTILTAIAFLLAVTLKWQAFTFVFGGIWSRGIHLFSVWAALFFLAVTTSVSLFLRKILAETENRTNPRARTVLKLTDSFIAYATGIIIVVGVLYMFGVNTTALIASAGVLSIAVGMGAKDMVADILAGMFLAIEDSVHMGDVVTVGSWRGRVTDMGIRTTSITDDSQNVKILNNSHISDVVNMSRKKTSCVLDMAIKRNTNMTETERKLKKAVEKASEEITELYGSLKLDGIHDISREGCTATLSYEVAEVDREAVTKRLKSFIEYYINGEMEKIQDTGNS